MATRLLAPIGRFALGSLATLGRMGLFFGSTVSWFLAKKPFVEGVIEQCVAIGVRTCGIMSLILFFIGANVALSGDATFRLFGGQSLLGIYAGLSCVVGLAPLLVGAMLAAKPGTEITAMIASMRVKEQIDALEVMAVNPYWYLMVPRFVAHLIVAPALVAFAYICSLAGAYVAAVVQLGNNPASFLNDSLRFLTIGDLWNGIVRGEIFAIVVCLIATFCGFFSRPGPAGVSRAINQSVVGGSVAIVVLNYILTELMYR